MHKIIILLSLLIFSPSSHASYDDEFENTSGKLFKEVVNISEYDSSPLDIRKSLLRVLLQNNWRILDQDKKFILSSYKNSKLMTTIKGSVITFEEMKSPEANFEFRQSWINSLKTHFLKDILYYYHLKEAVNNSYLEKG